MPNSYGRGVTEMLLINNWPEGAPGWGTAQASRGVLQGQEGLAEIMDHVCRPKLGAPCLTGVRPELERVRTTCAFARFSSFVERRTTDFQASRSLRLKCVKLDI